MLPVDISVVHEIKTAMSGGETLNFVTLEYSLWIQGIYDSLGIQVLMFQNMGMFLVVYLLVSHDLRSSVVTTQLSLAQVRSGIAPLIYSLGAVMEL